MTDVLPMDEDAVKSVEKVEKKYRMTKLNQSFTRNITDAEMEDKDANGIMEVLNDVYETMFSTFKNSKMVSYFCMSKQIGNDDHRPHVQGYIQFKRHFPNTEQMKVFWDQHGDVWHSPSKADAQTNVRYTQGKDKDDEDTSEVCWDWKEHGEADCNRIKEKEAGDFFDTFQELGYQAVTKDNVGTAARIHNVCRMAKTAHTFPVELKLKCLPLELLSYGDQVVAVRVTPQEPNGLEPTKYHILLAVTMLCGGLTTQPKKQYYLKNSTDK